MTTSTFGKFTLGTEVAAFFADRIHGKTILIPGGNPKGLGTATARALATHTPAKLIIAHRNLPKTQPLLDELTFLAPQTQIHSVQLDGRFCLRPRVVVAVDPVLAERLWKLSDQIVGEEFVL
ncbi:hypothetical protein BO71DRAFT_430398 [Aspergillus ellipticus CBS 707.79]|uniref:NAD(P)-binding protein n=1 Tax=Aspergillus ellipticus CBS 707.79 TaxID=1448320 RepID=A0A319DRZ9_9EURO|nr:hypothetical protein BO71DRAFT_430398 [Aspergillus ellipticus CBS 707.79]